MSAETPEAGRSQQLSAASAAAKKSVNRVHELEEGAKEGPI